MPLCLTFIDLKKAFDSVETEAVVEALDNQGVPTQYIKHQPSGANADRIRRNMWMYRSSAESTKTMFMRNGWISDAPFTLNETNISECTSYVYLGRELNMMNDLTPELGRRRRADWGAYNSVEDVAKKTRNTRLCAHLFNTTVLPVLTYASESWAFRKQEENTVTGYSLGGSLASMTSLYVTKKQLVDRSLIRLVTFGEPRTGNVAFAKEIEETIVFRYRIVKKNDFISSIPRSVDPTTSLLTATLFDRQPLFYRHLVHYDNNMEKNGTFSVCGLSDDFGCRNTDLSYDLTDHLTYFHIDIDQFIEDGCPRDRLF
ncbi:hypothetical protein RB195_024047 [Necator americanus]|uniref:Fungal lipase-type domain-containing protein n=2 Tax=Necator americanus TaxID=51031 RepID=A0ABR1ELR7_NECAM